MSGNTNYYTGQPTQQYSGASGLGGAPDSSSPSSAGSLSNPLALGTNGASATTQLPLYNVPMHLQYHPMQQLQQPYAATQQSQLVLVLTPMTQTLAPTQATPMTTNNLTLSGANSQMSLPPVTLTVHMPKEKYRIRVHRACDRCRTQKIKCSGTFPCNTCLKYKKDCTYEKSHYPQKRAGSPDDELISGADLRSSAVLGLTGNGILGSIPGNGLGANAGVQIDGHSRVPKHASDEETRIYLEKRVKYLENIILENSQTYFRREAANLIDPSQEIMANSTQLLLPDLIFPLSKWRYSRRHQNLLVFELSQILYKSLSKYENRRKVKVPRFQYFGWNMSGGHYIPPEELPSAHPNFAKYPPYGQVQERMNLVDYYFRNINPLFAILHEEVFRKQVAAYTELMESNNGAGPGSSSATPNNVAGGSNSSNVNKTSLFSALLFMTYALSLRFMIASDPNPNVELFELEEECFNYSYAVLRILSFQWESFELIQGWLLIALYLRMTHRQTTVNTAMNQAISMTRLMGIGSKVPKLQTATEYERLKAKRIFWSCYTMERVFALQNGRYGALNESDIYADPVRDYNFEEVGDTWLTKPAFALLHVSRIINFIYSSTNDVFDRSLVATMNDEMKLLSDWLDQNGFKDDTIFDDEDELDMYKLVKVQVKLHFYDLVLSLHGKAMFDILRDTGHPEHPGLLQDSLFEASASVTKLLFAANKRKVLYVPWYYTLLLLFNIGVNSLTSVYAGGHRYMKPSRDLLDDTIRLLTILKEAKYPDGKPRFKMAHECLWCIKMTNHMISLRLTEDLSMLKLIGIDHGSNVVNDAQFTTLGICEKEDENNIDDGELLNKTVLKKRKLDSSALDTMSTESNATALQGSPKAFYDNELLFSNLQWFDQWLDYASI